MQDIKFTYTDKYNALYKTSQTLFVILNCDIPIVLDTIRCYRIVQSKHN